MLFSCKHALWDILWLLMLPGWYCFTPDWILALLYLYKLDCCFYKQPMNVTNSIKSIKQILTGTKHDIGSYIFGVTYQRLTSTAVWLVRFTHKPLSHMHCNSGSVQSLPGNRCMCEHKCLYYLLWTLTMEESASSFRVTLVGQLSGVHWITITASVLAYRWHVRPV